MTCAPRRSAFDLADPDLAIELATGRLRQIQAVLIAIDAGELLSDTPADQYARARHRVGVALLDVMSRDLASLIEALDGRPVPGEIIN